MADELYITNYRDRRCSPMGNFARLSTEGAYALAKELSQHAGASFTSFSRFRDRDFEGYFEKRVRTEEWLYSSFIALGGRPASAHPLYFVLGESRYLRDWFEDGIETRLPLSCIDAADISFTLGDSMRIVDSVDRMGPFTRQSLLDFVLAAAADVATFLRAIDEQNKYIEVQLWNDVYVRDLVVAAGHGVGEALLPGM